MKNLISWVGIFGFVFLSAACSSGTPGATDGAKTPVNPKNNVQGQGLAAGGKCSEVLINDAQAILQAARAIPMNDQQAALRGLNQLKTQVQTFQQSYAGVVCKDHDGAQFDVDASCRDLLTKIDQGIAQLGGGNGGGLLDEFSASVDSFALTF